MDSPSPVLPRLITALEDLTRQEEALFNQGFYAESVEVQQRSMPVANEIASLLVAPGVARSLDRALQIRIQELLKRRQLHFNVVTDKVRQTELELKKLKQAEVRARMLRPAYGTKTPDTALAGFAAEG